MDECDGSLPACKARRLGPAGSRLPVTPSQVPQGERRIIKLVYVAPDFQVRDNMAVALQGINSCKAPFSLGSCGFLLEELT